MSLFDSIARVMGADRRKSDQKPVIDAEWEIVHARDDGRRVVAAPADDPRVSAAVRRARASVEQFIDALRDPPDGASGFSFKVPLPAGGSVEHVWVAEARVTESGRLEGRLDADTVSTTEPATEGDPIHCDPFEISDWAYVDAEGRLVGGETIRVFVPGATANAAR
jgi:uncharacterized protein YegJ (DUF2314 family)